MDVAGSVPRGPRQASTGARMNPFMNAPRSSAGSAGGAQGLAPPGGAAAAQSVGEAVAGVERPPGSGTGFTPPVISLPKGGGAVRGMGEKFAANPATGTGSLTIPLPLSPGRSGFGPALTLSYDSGRPQGPWGQGWGLD